MRCSEVFSPLVSGSLFLCHYAMEMAESNLAPSLIQQSQTGSCNLGRGENLELSLKKRCESWVVIDRAELNLELSLNLQSQPLSCH